LGVILLENHDGKKEGEKAYMETFSGEGIFLGPVENQVYKVFDRVGLRPKRAW
jgi:hypothetical protein